MIEGGVKQNTGRGGNKGYFEPESRLQLVDKLRHFVRFSDFLLLLTGDPGAGKSTLLQQLAPFANDSSIHVCKIAGSSDLNSNALLSALLAQVPNHSNQPATDQGYLIALNEQVQAFRSQGKRLLIIVDDADQLSEEQLELLINLQFANDNDDGTAPQLLLAGAPSLIDSLQESGWLESLAGRLHELELEPYSAEEMREYIQQYLPAVAASGEKQIAKLIAESGGLPGRVVNKTSATLPSAGKKKKRFWPQLPAFKVGRASAGRKAFPLPPLHMAAIAAMLVVITVAAAWQFSPEESPVVTVDNGGERIAVPLALNVAEGDKTDAPVSGNSELAKRLAEQEAKLRPTAEDKPVVAETLQPDSLPAETDAISAQKGAVAKPEPPAVAEPETVQSADKPQLKKEKPDSPVVAAKPSPAVAEKLKPAVTQPTAGEKQSVAATQTQAPAAKPQPAVAGNARIERDEKALMALPASGYMLQVLGARELNSIERFMQAYPGEKDLRAFSTLFKGKPWYVVVYGNYNSRSNAMAAIPQLPTSLRKQRPWARSLKGIQNDIKKK